VWSNIFGGELFSWGERWVERRKKARGILLLSLKKKEEKTSLIFFERGRSLLSFEKKTMGLVGEKPHLKQKKSPFRQLEKGGRLQE